MGIARLSQSVLKMRVGTAGSLSHAATVSEAFEAG